MLRRRIEKRWKAIMTGTALLLGMAILATATFVWPTLARRPTYDHFAVVSLIIILFLPAFVDLIDRRWRKAVNRAIPDFLGDVAQAQKTGLTFSRAIEHAAQREYGPLSDELRRTVALLSWGYGFDEALEDLARRVETPLMYRTAVMLVEVGKSGGRLTEILEAVHSHIKEVMDLSRERARQMVPYVAIIYASFGVYLFVVIILFVTFFSQVKEIIKSGAPFGTGLDPVKFQIWFLHMSIVEGTIGGFVAGKMGEGAIAAGLKHVLILTVLSLFVFLVVI